MKENKTVFKDVKGCLKKERKNLFSTSLKNTLSSKNLRLARKNQLRVTYGFFFFLEEL